MGATNDYLTECYICSNDYVDPRILPCIHTFCLECLENYRKASPSAGEIMHCPFCEKEFRIPEQGIVRVKKNFFLERLVKIKTIASPHSNDRLCGECFEDSELTDNAVQLAVQYCVQCSQFLCKDCSRMHRRSKLSKDHRLLDLGTEATNFYELLKDSSETIPCDKHSEEQLQMFCADCNSFVCASCVDEGHQQHKIRSIKSTADDFQNQLRQLIDDMSICVTGAEKKTKILMEEMTNFQRNINDCQEKIVSAVEDLKRLVDAQGKALIEELLCTKQKRLELLQTEVDELQTHMTLLEHFKNYCSEMNCKATKSDICDAFSTLSRQAKELQSMHGSDMHALTYFVTILFEKTQMVDQQNSNIVGKLRETLEVTVMQQEFGNSVMEDSANDSSFEYRHVLDPFIQDLKMCEKVHETSDTVLKTAHTSVQASRFGSNVNEPIFGSAQPKVEWRETTLNAVASNREPFTIKFNTEPGILEGLSGRQYSIKQAWSMHSNNKPEEDLDSLNETESSTGDELPDLDFDETQHQPSCEPLTCEKEVLSDPEENSYQPYAYNLPLKTYVNATSDIGLRFVMDQNSEAEPLGTEKMLTSSNIQIQAADSTHNLKHKLRTTEPKRKDDSKKPKGAGVLDLIHKLKTSSSEVFGVTSLQNKIYILRKKSVYVYSSNDPERSLTNIKLQDAITPFDICACKKSFAIYITDYGNYHKDRQKHCIWKVTVSDHKVSRWLCGIGEPYTLSVNYAGSVILLRIEADSQQSALEILNEKAELIRRICLPQEIEKPEHAVETSTGSFVICHKRNGYDIWTISEVNGNGEIVRRLKGTEQLKEPKHLAFDPEGRVFVADWGSNRVAVLEAQFKWVNIFFATKEDDKDGLRNPTRLCYVAEKNQLIVVSNSLRVSVYRVMPN